MHWEGDFDEIRLKCICLIGLGPNRRSCALEIHQSIAIRVSVEAVSGRMQDIVYMVDD